MALAEVLLPLTVMVVVPAAKAVMSPALTVATEGSLDFHSRISLQSFGRICNSREPLSPILRLIVLGVRVSEVAGTSGSMTVTLQDLEKPPSLDVAVISASPMALAVTLPFCVTETMSELEEVQVTDLSEASDGRTVAVMVTVCPR